MRTRLVTSLAAVFLGVAFCGAGEAAEGGISVTPVQLHLAPKSASTLLTVTNSSDHEVRFQIDVSLWNQDESGEMKLSPTKDVVFFPAFLVLPPNKEGKVRIGLPHPSSADAEKTYRIVLEEMPPPEVDATPGTVAVRTKMSIPIFVDPAAPKVATDVAASLDKGEATLEVRNTGNVHVMPKGLHLKGLKADGSVAFDQGFQGWYLLAGGRRVYRTTIAKTDCAKVVALVAEATVEGSPPLSHRVELSHPSCGK